MFSHDCFSDKKSIAQCHLVSDSEHLKIVENSFICYSFNFPNLAESLT